MANATFKHLLSLLLAGVAIVTAAYAQDPFTWHNSSIGGGGFATEIRYDPYGILSGDRALYLTTDVSGVYFSTDWGAYWSRIWAPYDFGEPFEPARYLTSAAFDLEGFRIVVGSTEGIYYKIPFYPWYLAGMPARDYLPSDLKQKMIDEIWDGKYPWVSIIREYPLNTEYMLAGIGDTRNQPAGVGKGMRFGLGAVMRSTDGGCFWDLVRLDGADPDEIVYDIDYVTDSEDSIHVFVTTGYTKQTADGYEYKGGIYYSKNVFYPGTSPPPDGDAVKWVKISMNPKPNGSLQDSLKNLVSLVVFTNNPAPDPVQTISVIQIYVTLCANLNGDTPKGGIYRTTTKLDSLTTLVRMSHPNNPDTSSSQPNWVRKYKGLKLGRLAATPNSTRNTFELYLGKQLGENLYLAVTNQDHINDGEMSSFKQIVTNESLVDNGYRELDPDGKPDLKFGSIEIDRRNNWLHPTVYGCWAYGPLQADGHNGAFDAPRTVRQIFTNKIGQDADGDDVFRSRGMDEVFFTGCPVAFKPGNSDVMLVGCGDNGLLRSTNGGVHWSQRRFKILDEKYGKNQQWVYQIAFHPLNSNVVLLSAGVEHNELNNPGKSALLINNRAGAGDENSWNIIGGGVDSLSGLPNREMDAVVFDVKDDTVADNSWGLFAAVRHKGIYYGKVNANGVVTSVFQKIADAQLTALIPAQATGNGDDGKHHYYSRLMFDPYNSNHLYVSRYWPSGGVFRITLGTDSSDVNKRAPFLKNGSYNNGFITEVVEVIKGPYTLKQQEANVDTNKAAEVINLLITQDYVFAGVTCGNDTDKAGKNYAGGLIQWAKSDDPGDYQWKIGGPDGIGYTNRTIAIGGMAQDPTNPNTILVVTYRFGLKADRKADYRYRGQENFKLMNIWQSTNGGASFTPLSGFDTNHKWADAATMSFVPGDPNKIIMPTHGNGIWIGTRTSGSPKAATPQEFVQTDENLPKRFALHQNYPNPFNPNTTIKFDLPRQTHVTLVIYDVLGRRVRTLVDEFMKAGYQSKVWDGKNDKGLPVASGVYFYRLHTTEFTKVRKMTLLQ